MDLHAARRNIRQMMVSVSERRAKLARHVSHREEAVAADFSEQAVELQNEETMVALDAQLVQDAKDLQDALARLDNGQYGRCESCGESIDERRLEALPATRYCIDCASRQVA
jgi:DnaK suppressor protein